MKCSKCSAELAEGSAFCGECGTSVASSVAPIPGAINTTTAATPVTAPVATATPVVAPAVEGGGKAIASLVLGILGLLGWIIPIIGLIMGILAIIFGSLTLKTNKKKLALVGLILGVITLILSLFAWGYNIMSSGSLIM